MMPVDRDRLLDRIVRRFGIPGIRKGPQDDAERTLARARVVAPVSSRPESASAPRKPGKSSSG